MKTVDIYTDGACSGNPGIGGWCAILIYGSAEKVISGGVSMTTNNRMEVFAAISGLAALKEKCNVRLYSDSAYLVNAVREGWIDNWINSDWKTSDNKPVKNQDLWRDFALKRSRHNVEFIKVKGHSDNEYNNRCDEIARSEIEKIRKNKQ